MAVLTSYSAADVLRHLLVKLGVATLPSSNLSWPAFVGAEPDLPNECITLYDTDPVSDGRTTPDLQWQGGYGIQVRVRSPNYVSGTRKSLEISRALDQVVLRSVTISGVVYLVHTVRRDSGPFAIGFEPETRRRIWTINFVAWIEEQ